MKLIQDLCRTGILLKEGRQVAFGDMDSILTMYGREG